MATHSSLAWRIPGTKEPGGLPSMGSHRVGHDWSNLAAAWQKKKCSKIVEEGILTILNIHSFNQWIQSTFLSCLQTSRQNRQINSQFHISWCFLEAQRVWQIKDFQQSEATIGNCLPKEVSLCFGQDKGHIVGWRGHGLWH